jgi:hypothetical protein
MAEDVLHPCAQCGQTFALSPRQQKRLLYNEPRKYGFCCSRRCVGLVGRAPRRLHDPILRICANCGKQYLVQHTSRDRPVKYGRCCSLRCGTLLRRRTLSHDTRSRGPRHFAGAILNKAIAEGQLERPAVCERCGARPGLNASGGPKIQGHHSDYSKPLSVEWLCVRCHRLEHPQLRGSAKKNSLLTETQIPEIRRMLATRISLTTIAKAFSVTSATINNIARGRTWGHVYGDDQIGWQRGRLWRAAD